MAVLTDYSFEGYDITDEKVVCSRSVTINSTEYFQGFICELPGDSVFGNFDPDYGIWTEVEFGGDRMNVVPVGLPGTDEISVDKTTGVVLSLVEDHEIFVTYRAHGRIFRRFDVVEKSVYKQGDVPNAADFYTEFMPYGGAFIGMKVILDQGPTGANLDLFIYNGDLVNSPKGYVRILDGSTSNPASFLFSQHVSSTEERVKIQYGENLIIKSGSVTGYPTNSHFILISG